MDDLDYYHVYGNEDRPVYVGPKPHGIGGIVSGLIAFLIVTGLLLAIVAVITLIV